MWASTSQILTSLLKFAKMSPEELVIIQTSKPSARDSDPVSLCETHQFAFLTRALLAVAMLMVSF